MKTAVEHSVYGIITYEESIWTGSRTLYVNGQALEKQSRNTFVLVRDKQTTYFTLKGSYLSGLKLTVDNQTFPIIAGPKWYEVLIVVTMALLYLVWANVPTLVVHLPVIGGAVGGAICGGVSIFSLYLMKLQQNPGMKILIGLSMGVLTFAITYAVGMLFLSVVM